MADERITTQDTPTPTAHTTIIREVEPRRSSGAGWIVAIVLIVAVIAGIYFFSQSSTSEVVRNDAIAGAAKEVGAAAGQVGDAAREAANRIAD